MKVKIGNASVVQGTGSGPKVIQVWLHAAVDLAKAKYVALERLDSFQYQLVATLQGVEEPAKVDDTVQSIAARPTPPEQGRETKLTRLSAILYRLDHLGPEVLGTLSDESITMLESALLAALSNRG